MIDTFLTQILAGGAAGEPAGGGLLLVVMFALLALLVFMTFRRNRKMRQAQQEAHSSAVIGAEVLTAGGVVGTVVARDEERQRVTLEFSNGDRVDFLLGAVQQVLTPAAGQQSDEDD
ncbi:preprotein translocase subunit YajC [Nesterenkonia sp.]|uniref:preprotein translocase subunit YajC n=1 Tax=Nesterenkonia sp. TaxID=704201 RepID=UPI0026259E8F|nr:preprotein translocase subunit YajC [Nesterenkonia sp.]